MAIKTRTLKQITLSNDSVYYVYEPGQQRVTTDDPSTHFPSDEESNLSGSKVLDKFIQDNNLLILSIDFITETYTEDDNIKYIKQLRLSDGNTYNICDIDAARAVDLQNYLPISGDNTYTGNLTVDGIIRANNLLVLSIDWIPVNIPITNVLVEDEDTQQIKKRSTNQLLEDIGGISYNINDSTGVLSLKEGRQ